MSRRRRSAPRRIDAVLGQVLGELGLEAAEAAFRIGELWESVVGAEIARHARPVCMRGTVLEVEVDASVWCQQLQMQRPALVARLREAVGEGAPSDLRLRVGYNRPASR